MDLFTIIAVLLPALLYGILVLTAAFLWMNSKPTVQEKNSRTVSVAVAARNESKSIGKLIRAMLPSLYREEAFLTIADDASEDNTAEIINSYVASETVVRLVRLDDEPSISPKQRALTAAIEVSESDVILMTDADCTIPDEWIITMRQMFDDRTLFVSGPVKVEGDGFLSWFQSVEQISLTAFTSAGFEAGLPFMANGANMGIRKDIFKEHDGFGSAKTASGDDVFLLASVVKNKGKGAARFVKRTSAIVKTRGAETWNEYFQQRVRWASKNKRYRNPVSLVVALVVLFCLISVLALWIAAVFNSSFVTVALIATAIKVGADLMLFLSAAPFFQQTKLFWMVVVGQPLLVISYLLVFLRSLKGSYVWKGRMVKE